MMAKRWPVLLIGAVLVLIISSVGMTSGSFIEQERSIGNSFQSWSSRVWTQTTQKDFNLGVLINVDTSSSPEDVTLILVPSPALITSDDREVSVSGDSAWHLVKTLTFTKSGSIYNNLRIDSSLKTTGTSTASSSIRIDDIQQFSHSTYETTYQSYSDILDFSSYPNGQHTVKLYLQTSNRNRAAYNSIFELYITNSYAASGTIASQVLDTGVSGDRWDALFWDEVLQKNTNVTFEVRASDTPFTKDDVKLAWISVKDISPVISSLPSGRYKQWRATLITSDATKTPTLNEVIVYYY
jgi:hypothetical protein